MQKQTSKTPDSSNLENALMLAFKSHAGTSRDGTSPLPYITHPFEVVNNLRYIGGIVDSDILCAGALHDVIEEAGVSIKKIEKRFGSSVSQLVLEMTRYEPSEEEVKGFNEDQIWQLRSDILLEEIRHMSALCRLIKLADRLSNLRAALVTKKGIKRERYVKQSQKILEIIPRELNPPLWDSIQELLGQTSTSEKRDGKNLSRKRY